VNCTSLLAKWLFQEDISNISDISNIEKIAIDEHIILKKLLNLKITKSSQLHTRVIHGLRNEIAFLLKTYFWKYLNRKKAHLLIGGLEIYLPYLRKAVNLMLCNYYRPISLTCNCICCKLLESIIRDHLLQFLLRNKLFSNKQYGFIKGRSTVQQLLKVLDDLTEKLEYGGHIEVL